MIRRSIFSGVVRNENAHTQLLINLMEYSEAFCNFVLAFLQRPDLQSKEVAFETQCPTSSGGIPDITVFRRGTNHVYFHLEVKTSRDCRRTGHQRSGYGEMDTYLVPSGWLFRDEVAPSNLRYWEELTQALGKKEGLLTDPLVDEYKRLLDMHFMSVELQADVEAIPAGQQAGFIALACKLHLVIDTVADRLRSEKTKNAALLMRPELLKSEYGYFIREGGKELLWFGMWQDPAMLFGAAYQAGWHKFDRWHDPRFKQDGAWHVFSMDGLIRECTGDVVQFCVEQIEGLLALVRD